MALYGKSTWRYLEVRYNQSRQRAEVLFPIQLSEKSRVFSFRGWVTYRGGRRCGRGWHLVEIPDQLEVVVSCYTSVLVVLFRWSRAGFCKIKCSYRPWNRKPSNYYLEKIHCAHLDFPQQKILQSLRGCPSARGFQVFTQVNIKNHSISSKENSAETLRGEHTLESDMH